MEHPLQQCPAFNKTCSVCQRRGHFANMCFWKNKNMSKNQAKKVEVVNETAAAAKTSKVETVLLGKIVQDLTNITLVVAPVKLHVQH
uniref:Uncharacterized protein LOC114325315 isoform X1 n=1 Tax=Diabrotica virgifera virgifera TaxID=50390 RepID=A0A6P7F1F4_DIAVI